MYRSGVRKLEQLGHVFTIPLTMNCNVKVNFRELSAHKTHLRKTSLSTGAIPNQIRNSQTSRSMHVLPLVSSSIVHPSIHPSSQPSFHLSIHSSIHSSIDPCLYDSVCLYSCMYTPMYV